MQRPLVRAQVGAQKFEDMKIKFNHENVEREAERLSDIAKSKDHKWRYNVVNYTTGDNEVNVQYMNIKGTLINPSEEDEVDMWAVVQDRKIVFYSDSHLKEVATFATK